MKENEYPKT